MTQNNEQNELVKGIRNLVETMNARESKTANSEASKSTSMDTEDVIEDI